MELPTWVVLFVTLRLLPFLIRGTVLGFAHWQWLSCNDVDSQEEDDADDVVVAEEVSAMAICHTNGRDAAEAVPGHTVEASDAADLRPNARDESLHR